MSPDAGGIPASPIEKHLFPWGIICGDERLVLERLAEMDERIARIGATIQSYKQILPTLTEPELRQYTSRLRTDGELKAMEWLVAQRQAER